MYFTGKRNGEIRTLQNRDIYKGREIRCSKPGLGSAKPLNLVRDCGRHENGRVEPFQNFHFTNSGEIEDGRCVADNYHTPVSLESVRKSSS